MHELRVCPDADCGFNNEPGRTTCLQCGTPLRREASKFDEDDACAGGSPVTRPAQVERSRNMLLFYLAIWIPVILFGVFFIAYC